MGDPPGLGWSTVDQKEAKGILIAALGMLASHYGYSEANEPVEACIL